MAHLVTWLAVVATICSIANIYGLPERRLFVGYYATWAKYRPGDGQCDVDDIDPSFFTHLIYAYGFLNETSYRIEALDPLFDLPHNGGRNNYGRFVSLTRKNPSLKVLLAIGGWNEGSVKFSQMASKPERRKVFVQSASYFVKKYKFDGLDIDWEYPALRGGIPEDKQNFVLLLKDLREEFNKYGLLLTIAIGAKKEQLDVSYDFSGINKYVDLINVMSYDYHGSWETETGFVATLYARPNDTLENQQLTINFTINYLLELGAAREKLVMGMPIYGSTFTLEDESKNGVFAPAIGPGAPGPFTARPGILGYNEICLKIKDFSWNVKNAIFEKEWYQYAFNGNQWISVTDPYEEKVDFLLSYNLSGAMVWSIDTDDFRGKCGSKYTILKRIFYRLYPDKTTTKTTTTTTTEITDTPTTSETEQTTSETEQTTSETEQTTSETEQTTSETEQTTSETEQTTSETEQTTSETEQTTSETEQTTSETEQTTSETEQTTSETEQTTSETEQTTTEATTTEFPTTTESTTATAPTTAESTTASEFTTIAPETTTSVEDYIRSRCHEGIKLQDPTDCHFYWQCVPKISGGWDIYMQPCPFNLGFNEATQECDFKQFVPGC